MLQKTIELPYTLCFCLYQQNVLMLSRKRPPNAHLWNGLGGKIEAHETPLASMQREVHEEAGLDLSQASSLFFAGIATWGTASQNPIKGMYVFLTYLSKSQAEQIHSLDTPEGLLAWKPLEWICDLNNQKVVSNIPRFLPPMLKAKSPCEYFYEYELTDSSTEVFRQLVISPLPTKIILSNCQE